VYDGSTSLQRCDAPHRRQTKFIAQAVCPTALRAVRAGASGRLDTRPKCAAIAWRAMARSKDYSARFGGAFSYAKTFREQTAISQQSAQSRCSADAVCSRAVLHSAPAATASRKDVVTSSGSSVHQRRVGGYARRWRREAEEDWGAMTQLILRRAPVGWKQDDYDVVAGGILVGRIFLAPAAPDSRQWMWTIGHDHHEDRTPTHDYEPRGSYAGVRPELA
jgi:hypothetical protein